MQKVKLTAAGTEPIELELDHAQRLLDYEKERGLNLWSVAENGKFEVVNGKIIQKSGSNGGSNA